MKHSQHMNRWLELAHKLSFDSCHTKQPMAAVAIRGGVVISVASNHRKRFGHAELRLASRTNDLTGATVYVMRWNKRVSRPCAMCRETMKFRGVKKAVFIDENGKVAEERYT